MKWLKNKILKWLGINTIYTHITIHSERLNKLEELINVGVDVHHKGRSWAVICMEGKPDYIKFIDLDKKTLFEIGQFLRQFERSNNIRIDANPFDSNLIRKCARLEQQ